MQEWSQYFKWAYLFLWVVHGLDKVTRVGGTGPHRLRSAFPEQTRHGRFVRQTELLVHLQRLNQILVNTFYLMSMLNILLTSLSIFQVS